MDHFTYAQAGEDILLFRALKDVPIGFYIDVGAADPVSDSVTLLFHRRGWTGLNVEPLAEQFDLLRAHRPNDLNVNAAAWHENTKITFYACLGALGLSTSNRSFAEQAIQHGGRLAKRMVPAFTLNHMLASLGQPEIHFLKIDVEGGEANVLKGLDFKIHRPWIVVIEAHEPMSSVQSHQEWEAFLFNADYHFVAYDGLNRYYVRDESQRLDAAFARGPVSPFDGFQHFAPMGNAIDNAAHPDRDWLKCYLGGLYRTLGNLGPDHDYKVHTWGLTQADLRRVATPQTIEDAYRRVLGRSGFMFREVIADPTEFATTLTLAHVFKTLLTTTEYHTKRARALRYFG